MAVFLVTLHDRSGSNFLGAPSVPTRTLGTRFDMLVLPLLLLTDSPQMFSPWHFVFSLSGNTIESEMCLLIGPIVW